MGFKLFHQQCAPLQIKSPRKKTEEGRQKKNARSRTTLVSLLSRKRQPKPLPSAAATLQEAQKDLVGGRYLSPKPTGSLDNSSSDTSETTRTASWKSCDSPDYKRCTIESFDDTAVMWNRALQDSRRLPQSTKFSNNHIMVNAERSKRCAPALKRISHLDTLARWHAEKMASENKVLHADEMELLSKLERPTDILGENVARGESIRSIHQAMCKIKSDIYNMTDRRFTEMGMATARGPDGDLFLCQIFRR